MPGTRLPPGATPWDTLNGFRIGALAGGLVGAAVAVLAGGATIPLILGGATLGAAIGYVVEKQRSRRR